MRTTLSGFLKAKERWKTKGKKDSKEKRAKENHAADGRLWVVPKEGKKETEDPKTPSAEGQEKALTGKRDREKARSKKKASCQSGGFENI